MAEEDPWLTLSEAAQRSGLAREAIRARARRGQIASRKGNRGELMVQLSADLLAGSDQAVTGPLAGFGQGVAGPQADLLADLAAEVADLRERLARAEADVNTAKAVAMAEVAAAKAVGEARVETAKDAAAARVTAAKTEAAAVRELADRLTHELLAARLELADARRPWWRRLYR